MGRNAEIKRFEPRPPGQPQDLFDTLDGRRPAVLELLGTPWVRRASELAAGAGAGRRAEVPVEVVWNSERGRPVSFVRGGRRLTVDAVAAEWSIERYWWDRASAESRRCFRVLAHGGVWDLAYDRLQDRWLLVGVVD